MFDLENTILELFPGVFKSTFEYRSPGVKFPKSSRYPKTYIRLFSLTSWVEWYEHCSNLSFLSQVTAKNGAKPEKSNFGPLVARPLLGIGLVSPFLRLRPTSISTNMGLVRILDTFAVVRPLFILYSGYSKNAS